MLRAPEGEDPVGGVDAVDANLLQGPALGLPRQPQAAQAGQAADLEPAARVDIGVRMIPSAGARLTSAKTSMAHSRTR